MIVTCSLKSDPIVKLGSKEKNYGQKAIYSLTDYRYTKGGRSLTIKWTEHSRNMQTAGGKGTDIL